MAAPDLLPHLVAASQSRNAFIRIVLTASLMLALLTGATAAPGGPAPGGFQTSAPFAVLMDADSSTVLFEKNADQLMAPASMAKLMTAEMVFNEIKQDRLTLDQELPVSEDAWRRGGAPSLRRARGSSPSGAGRAARLGIGPRRRAPAGDRR